MKKWRVRSWSGALSSVHQEVIEAQIKTDALNRFYEKHPEDKGTLRVTASPVKERA
jgi:hypothetical protein